MPFWQLYFSTRSCLQHMWTLTHPQTQIHAVKILKMGPAVSVFWWKKSQGMLQCQFLGFKPRVESSLLEKWHTVFLHNAKHVYICLHVYQYSYLWHWIWEGGIREEARKILRWLFFILLKKILTELANSLWLLAKTSHIEKMSIQILPWRVQKRCTQVSWHWHI